MSIPAGSEPEPPGLRCPKCGCRDLRVTKTVRLAAGRIRRYRRCRHCARPLTTLEMPVAEAKRRYTD